MRNLPHRESRFPGASSFDIPVFFSTNAIEKTFLASSSISPFTGATKCRENPMNAAFALHHNTPSGGIQNKQERATQKITLPLSMAGLSSAGQRSEKASATSDAQTKR
jgi:hypothetical protein